MMGQGSNVTTGEECYGLMPLEDPVAVCGAVCLHTVSLGVLAAFVRAVSCGVDISHPVFAVVHQELKVVMAAESIICLFFGISLVHHAEVFLLLMCIVSTLSMQFHQLSWLGITILRYTFGDRVILTMAVYVVLYYFIQILLAGGKSRP